jgi:hypothetical protein
MLTTSEIGERPMTTPLFSINAASETLERDRRTVKKALRHVKPDKLVNKQPRWRLKTILDALSELPGSHNANVSLQPVVHHDWLNSTNWRDPRIVAALVEFNRTFAEMKAISDMAKRRAFAIAKLGPLIAFHDKNFRKWETDNPAPGRFANDDVSVGCRVSLLWTQQREAVESACSWNYEQCYEFLIEPFQSDD